MQWIRAKFFALTQRQRGSFLFVLFLLLSFTAPVDALAADLGEAILAGITMVVAFLIGELFIPLMGKIMVWLLNGVVAIAQYNSFGSATAVTIGWILMRDIANMVLVALMLAMAFGTLLNQGAKLGDSKGLPKFVIIAVVINFSKMITLLVIDVGQVVMLSFVAAFQNTAGGNFIRAFGIKEWFKLSSFDQSTYQSVNMLIGLAMAAILVTVVVVVMMVFLAYLVARIAMLWILIIFSPLVFAIQLVPSRGKKFYDEWWDHLIKTISTGPMLAFFLWLTLMVAGVSNGALGDEVLQDSQQILAAQKAETAQTATQVKSGVNILDTSTMMTYFITITMLLLGLKISIEMGGVVSGAASGFVKKAPGRLWRGAKRAYQDSKKVGAFFADRPITRGGASLKQYAQAGADRAKKSKLGRAVGMDKDYKELQQMQGEAQARRAVGDKVGASKVESQILSKSRENLKDVGTSELKNMLQSETPGSAQHKAAGLELAKKGALKTDAGIDLAAGGDDAHKAALIREHNNNNKNSQILSVGAGEDRSAAVAKQMAGMSQNEQRKVVANSASNGRLEVAVNGEVAMVRRDTTDQLLNVDPDVLQNKDGSENRTAMDAFKDGAVTVMANDPDKDKKAAMGAKLGQETGLNVVHDPDTGAIDGTAPGMADLSKRQSGILADQAKTITEAKTASAKKGVSGSVVHGSYSSMSRGQQAFTESSLDTLDTFTTAVMKSPASNKYENAGVIARETRKNLSTQFKALDVQGKKLNRNNADGSPMTNQQAFDTSDLSKSLGELEKAYTRRHAMDAPGSGATNVEKTEAAALIGKLRKEVTQHAHNMKTGKGGVAGVVSQSKRASRTKHGDRASAVAKELKGAMAAIKKVSTPKDQRAAMKKAHMLMKTGSRSLEKSAVSVQKRNEIKELKQELKILEQELKTNVFKSVGDQKDLIDEMDKMVKRYNNLKDDVA